MVRNSTIVVTLCAIGWAGVAKASALDCDAPQTRAQVLRYLAKKENIPKAADGSVVGGDIKLLSEDAANSLKTGAAVDLKLHNSTGPMALVSLPASVDQPLDVMIEAMGETKGVFAFTACSYARPATLQSWADISDKTLVTKTLTKSISGGPLRFVFHKATPKGFRVRVAVDGTPDAAQSTNRAIVVLIVPVTAALATGGGPATDLKEHPLSVRVALAAPGHEAASSSSSASTSPSAKVSETERRANIRKAGDWAEKQGIDRCFGETVVCNESKGNPWVISDNAAITGQTNDPPNPTPNPTRADLGLSWKTSKGIGLAQITIVDTPGYHCADGSLGHTPSNQKKCFTAQQLLSIDGNLENMSLRLKNASASVVKAVASSSSAVASRCSSSSNMQGQSADAIQARGVFAVYGRSDWGDTCRSTLNTRVKDFIECKRAGGLSIAYCNNRKSPNVIK